MGLGTGAVKLMLELNERGLLKDVSSVVEIGSQELHLTQAEFEKLVEVAGISNYQSEQFANLKYWPAQSPRCPAKNLYELLGARKYNCVDLNGELGSIPHDMNLPFDDASYYAKYDLVSDHGCNEHIFNVAEAYRTMHRLCKSGGILVNIQAVWRGNGYYRFDASFFEGIAAANNYRILYSAYVVSLLPLVSAAPGAHAQFHIPVSEALLDVINWSKTAAIGICYVFQKQSDAEFRIAYQGDFLSRTQKNHGYKLQFLPTPFSRSYVPLREHALDVIYTKDLILAVAARVSKRIKKGMTR